MHTFQTSSYPLLTFLTTLSPTSSFERRRRRRRRESEEAAANALVTEQTTKLEAAIRNPGIARDLINHLLQYSELQLQLQVRFIVYVLQFESIPPCNQQERRIKGQAIIEMFLGKHSHCKLQALPNPISEDIDLASLSCIKKQVLAALMQQDEVQRFFSQSY